MIITPGYKFETALMKAQDQYTDAKFVILDGSPNNGNCLLYTSPSPRD